MGSTALSFCSPFSRQCFVAVLARWASSLYGNKMLSAPADNIHNQPATAVKARQVLGSGCGVLESAWSPDAKKPPRGFHRRPSRDTLNLVFLVFLPVSG